MQINYVLTLRIAIIALMLIGLIGIKIQLSEAEESNTQAFEPKAVTVEIQKIAASSSFSYQSIAGTTRAAERATIRSQVAGRILHKHVKQGDQIQANDILITLYNPEASPVAQSASDQWQQAIVSFRQQKRNFQRTKNLHKSGAATEQEFENAKTALLSAKSSRDAAEAQFQRASQVKDEQLVRAPFAGIVTNTLIEAGEVVGLGQALVQIANPRVVEVEVAVSERIANQNNLGDIIPLSLPLIDANHNHDFISSANSANTTNKKPQGRIVEISPFRERGALPTVVVQLDTDTVAPGSTALLHFPIESLRSNREQFKIPVSAVVSQGNKTAAVYKLSSENKAVLIPVSTHGLLGTRVIVSGNLAENDRLVISGTKQLYAGAPVRIQAERETK